METLEKNENVNSNPSVKEDIPVGKKQRITTIVGIVICLLLVPILIINCILIIKSLTSDDVPAIGGKIPLIVLTESMEPDILAGDLIICSVPDEEDIESIGEGAVISFFDPAGNGTSIVTHRVNSVEIRGGKRYFRTQGVNNNTEDRIAVSEDDIVGIYNGTRIFGLGKIAMFMQSTAGLIICIFVPLAALIGFELLRIRKQDKEKEGDIEALMAELKILKEEQSAKEENKASGNTENSEKSEDVDELKF